MQKIREQLDGLRDCINSRPGSEMAYASRGLCSVHSILELLIQEIERLEKRTEILMNLTPGAWEAER